MGTKKIGVDVFDIKSINDCLYFLDNWIINLNNKIDLVFQILVEEGVDEIANVHGYTEDGEIKVSWRRQSDNVWVLYANGRGVCFIEYGAGDLAGTGFTPVVDGIDASPGSYSSSFGTEEYARFGTWTWNGLTFNAIAPRSGFFWASARMRNRLIDIAKEVFKD